MYPVSLHILAFNNRDSLRAAIFSVIDVCEVVVGDADGTHKDLVPSKCRYITVPNDNLSDNRNRCVAVTDRPYIGIVDGDDYRYGETLEYQVDFLENNPDVGVVAGPYIKEDKDGVEALTSDRYEVSRARMEKGTPFGHGSVLVRKSAFDAVGGYQDYLWANDYDLFFRLWDAGWRLVYLPEKIIYYYTNNLEGITWTEPEDARIRAVQRLKQTAAERLERGEVQWLDRKNLPLL